MVFVKLLLFGRGYKVVVELIKVCDVEKVYDIVVICGVFEWFLFMFFFFLKKFFIIGLCMKFYVNWVGVF